MSDKEHCRTCGAELVECDGCHGSGMMHFDGPMDNETGYVGYDEPCSECSGQGGYAAPAAPVAAQTPEAEGADAYLIYFEDSERQDEVFLGHGAKEAAEERFADVSDSWNAHLFVCTETNVAAEVNPFKVASPPAAQELKPVALNYALTPLEQFADGIRAGRTGKLDRATIATALETIITACQQRLFASPTPASGWVMVPRELTKPMHEIMESADLGHAESAWLWKEVLAAVAVGETK